MDSSIVPERTRGLGEEIDAAGVAAEERCDCNGYLSRCHLDEVCEEGRLSLEDKSKESGCEFVLMSLISHLKGGQRIMEKSHDVSSVNGRDT